MMQWYGNYLHTFIVDRDSSKSFPQLKPSICNVLIIFINAEAIHDI